MNVADVIELLKEYNMYDEAQNECRRKKVDRAPYDMRGHHEIYGRYLSKKWNELRDKRDSLLKIKCLELNNISNNSTPIQATPIQEECFFVGVYCTKNYCRTQCKYYKENLEKLIQEMNKISEAEQVLKEAVERDETLI